MPPRIGRLRCSWGLWQAACEESQAALKLVNRELNRLQQGSMYATDAVAATKRQEAAAERTTRQTALSFTRELVQKRERAAVAAAETAAAYAEAQAGWERSIVAWEGAQHGLEAAGSMALANREVAATRLVEAQHDMVSTPPLPHVSSHLAALLTPMRCCARQVQREAAVRAPTPAKKRIPRMRKTGIIRSTYPELGTRENTYEVRNHLLRNQLRS